MTATVRPLLMAACCLSVLLAGCPHDQANGPDGPASSEKRPADVSGVDHAGKVVHVYADDESPSNQFAPSGWLGDYETDVELATACEVEPHEGKTCVKVTYGAEGESGWACLYWLHPKANWGQVAGHDLKGATRLTFWARGEKGGEMVSFKMGGVPGPQRDTAEAGLEKLALASTWAKFTIDLASADLSNVVGGFACTVTKADNPEGCTFYLDEIRFEMPPQPQEAQ